MWSRAKKHLSVEFETSTNNNKIVSEKRKNHVAKLVISNESYINPKDFLYQRTIFSMVFFLTPQGLVRFQSLTVP